MGFLNTLFGGKRERSSDVARERLLTVLVHDRVKLTPEMLDYAYAISDGWKTRKQLRKWFTLRRDGLIALLRKSIERDEPLRISS